MAEISTKPYMIRAIYEWCCDCGYTPYLLVKVGGRALVPVQHVRDGEIVLNISPVATNALRLGNDLIEFEARFNGVPEQIVVPVGNVAAIYARESGSGMAFSPEIDESGDEEGASAQGAHGGPKAAGSKAPAASRGGRVRLKSVPNNAPSDGSDEAAASTADEPPASRSEEEAAAQPQKGATPVPASPASAGQGQRDGDRGDEPPPAPSGGKPRLVRIK